MIPPFRRSRGRRWRERNRAERTSLEVALRCSSCAAGWERRRGLVSRGGSRWSPQSREGDREGVQCACVRCAGCMIGMMRVYGLPCDRDIWLRVPPVSGGFPDRFPLPPRTGQRRSTTGPLHPRAVGGCAGTCRAIIRHDQDVIEIWTIGSGQERPNGKREPLSLSHHHHLMAQVYTFSGMYSAGLREWLA